MKLQHKVDVSKKRRTEYPEVGDQLDAMVALAETLAAHGIPIPEKTQAWIDACNEVKANNEKVSNGD